MFEDRQANLPAVFQEMLDDFDAGMVDGKSVIDRIVELVSSCLLSWEDDDRGLDRATPLVAAGLQRQYTRHAEHRFASVSRLF